MLSRPFQHQKEISRKFRKTTKIKHSMKRRIHAVNKILKRMSTRVMMPLTDYLDSLMQLWRSMHKRMKTLASESTKREMNSLKNTCSNADSKIKFKLLKTVASLIQKMSAIHHHLLETAPTTSSLFSRLMIVQSRAAIKLIPITAWTKTPPKKGS